MITKEELNRVNVINENIHRLTELNKLFEKYEKSNKTDFDEITYYFDDIHFNTLIKEYIPKMVSDMMIEYNRIISPSEPNNLSQS